MELVFVTMSPLVTIILCTVFPRICLQNPAQTNSERIPTMTTSYNRPLYYISVIISGIDRSFAKFSELFYIILLKVVRSTLISKNFMFNKNSNNPVWVNTLVFLKTPILKNARTKSSLLKLHNKDL